MRQERLVWILATYALAYFFLMRLPGDILRSPIAGSDLSSYYTAGYLLRTGEGAALYSVAPGDAILGDATAGPWRQAADRLGIARQHHYIYPPFFAILAAPLSLLPFDLARLVWMGLELCLLGLTVGLYLSWRRMDSLPVGPMEGCLIGVTLGLECLPLIWELAIGQTSLLLLACLAGTMWMIRKQRPAAAGLALGLAAAIKLTPALLIVYFALRGRARLAAWATASFLGANLLSAALLGPALTISFYAEIVPAMSGGTAYFLNQSLTGLFDRLLTQADVRQVELVASPAARLAAAAAGLILIAVTALALKRAGARWGSRSAPAGAALDLEVSAVLLLTLMLSPISWSHHYLVAALPLWTLVAAAGRFRRFSPTLAAACGLAWLLIARKPHAELFLTGPGRLALSASLGGALILWAGCLIVRGWRARLERDEMELSRAA